MYSKGEEAFIGEAIASHVNDESTHICSCIYATVLIIGKVPLFYPDT